MLTTWAMYVGTFKSCLSSVNLFFLNLHGDQTSIGQMSYCCKGKESLFLLEKTKTIIECGKAAPYREKSAVSGRQVQESCPVPAIY